MAAVVTVVKKQDIGDAQEVLATVAFDASYPTGGEALAASDFGMRVGVLNDVQAQSNSGYVFQWDQANKKLLAFESGADGTPNDEVGNAVDLSALTAVRCVARGR